MFKVRRITSGSNSQTINKNSHSGKLSASKLRLLLTTALVGGISIGISAAFAGDPISISSQNSVSRTNTDTINATGIENNAIEIESEENVTVTNSGTITSSGGMGIFLGAAGDTDLSNNADVSSFEESLNIFGYKSANVDNTGSLTANHLAGISAGSFGDVAVKNTGEVEAARGVSAFSTAGTPAIDELGLSSAPATNGGSVTIDNEGDISLTVEFDEQRIVTQDITIEHKEIGILGLATNGLTVSSEFYTDEISTALSTNPDGLDVKITNKGAITDADKTDSPTSIGIGGGALGDVTIKNEGDIDVSLIAIYTLAGGDIDVVNDGALEVSGSGAVAIELEHLEDAEANITLTNNGDIEASNADEAIDIDSGGTATVKNTGDIDGGTYVGIEVEAVGAVNVTNSGKIETTGYNSDGIAASSETSDTTVNSGEIIASDAGIRAGGFGPTKVTNLEDGNIHGGNVGIDSGGGGASTIVNAGKLEADEIGISGVVFGGTAEFIEKDEDGTETKKKFTVTGGELDITNSGTITMVSPNSRDETAYELDGQTLKVPESVAIFAASLNGGTEINKQYDEFGQPDDDRDEFTALADDAANNAVSITNSGTIDGSSSYSSHGIYAMASDGVDIDNSGDITVANEAIFVTGASPVSIVNSGNIKVSNSGKVAISASSHQESGGPSGKSVSVKNSGKIVASGFDTYGIEINHEALGTVENSGEISALNNGINAGGYGNLVVTNQKTGNIHGVSIGISGANGGGSKITNAGKIEANKAGIDAVTFGGKGTIADGDGSSFDVSVPGGKIDIINSGTITMITPTFETNDVFELDGHSLSVPANTGIFAVSMNGGSHTSRYTDDSGQQQEESSTSTPIADDTADNSVSVTNSGKIDGTNSDVSSGIYAMASDGVDIDNSGDITVANEAIFVTGASPVSIVNSGNIKVSGSIKAAVNATSVQESEGPGGKSVTVKNSGKIEASGDGVDGIKINSDETGTIINSGEIIASSEGITAGGLGSFVVTNQETGNIHGANIALSSGNGGGTKISNAGKIEAKDIGINAVTFGGNGTITDGDGSSFDVSVPGGKVDVTNSGTITMIAPNLADNDTYELDGHSLKVPNNVAIFAVSMNGGTHLDPYTNNAGQQVQSTKYFTAAAADAADNSVSVTNSGTIDGTATNWSHGIYAMASDGVDIDNSGDITVGASAINVTGTSPITIKNSGIIKVNGEFGSHAVLAISERGENNTVGEAVSVENSGTIDLTNAGNYRRAVMARSNGGTSTITNSGTVITTAEGARGLHASSGTVDECRFDDDGNCERISPVGGGTITINSSGSVSTAGDNARAVSTWSHGGAINIDTSGKLTTKGDYSGAIHAFSGELGGGTNKVVAKTGGAITINNSSIIGTEGDFAYGITAYSNGGTVDATNEGKIATAGKYSSGINLKSGNSSTKDGNIASKGGDVTLTNKAGGAISTTAEDARAIQIGSTTGNLTIVNHADLSTVGNKASGVDAYSGSNKKNEDGTNFAGGKISITNTGDIATQGATAYGLSSWSNGETVTIDNSGAISTKGEKGKGIGAYSGVGNTRDDRVIQAGSHITLSNAGSVKTEGNEAYGIDTYTYGGAIQIDLASMSSVSTTGDKARALSAASGGSTSADEKVPATGGNIEVNINGLLSTTGESANAADMWTNGGDITINIAAGSKISTEGASSTGVNANSGEIRTTDGYEAHDGGAINITNAGTVSTKGDGSSALSAVSTNNSVAVNNSGTLTATGNRLIGIASYSGSEEDSTAGQAAIDGKKVTVTNSGNVTLSGSDSVAIVASSENNIVSIVNSGTLNAGTSATGQVKNAGIVVMRSSLVTVENSGAISVKGDEAIGLLAVSKENTQITNTGDINADGMLSLAGISVGDVTIENSGDLTLNRSMDPENDWNGALMALSNSNVSIANTGDVATTGSGMRAIHSSRAPKDIGGDDTHPDTVKIENSGNLSTDGESAHGIYVESAGVISITNTGDSIVTGNKANGLVALAETTTEITNTGIISSTTGDAVVTGKSADTFTNSGSLIGGAMFGYNKDILTNTGTLEGKFDFGSDDDALNLNAGSVYKDAIFDGGDGTDKVNFSGGGALAGAEFKNFETATLAEGSWTLSDTLNSFNTFNVANKSTLVLNKGVLGAAQTNILAESTLKGSGTISGGLTNNGSILLASSDTLKIEGDFHSATNSKLEFALGGGDGSTHSKIEVIDGKFTFDSSDVFNIVVDENTDLSEDSRYQIATADGGVDDESTTNDTDAVTINDSSAAFAFERTVEDNAVWIMAKATITDAVTELAPDLEEQANAVQSFVVDSGAGGALAQQLNGLNETQLVTAVEELTTPNEAAGHQSLNSTVSTANNIVDNRIAGRISGSSQRNFYTGDQNAQSAYRAGAGQTEASKVVMAYGGEGIVGSRWLDDGGYTQAWAQAFWGNTSIENSDSNQYGTSVGLDFRPDRNTLIGGSFSYSRTNADATNSSLEADTYGGMLYGAKGFDSGLAFSGVIGYFHTQNESKRQALGSVYSGDFDSNTFTLSGNISQEIEMQNWLFTPNAGVRYSHATFDDYTETGGLAPLTISRSDLDSVELSAEASFTRNFNVTDTTKGLFEFHFGGLYEAGDNDTAVAYRFSPTGAVLNSNSEVARLKFNVGTLVEIPFSDQISSEFAYEGTFADDYADHLLRAKFKLKF